MTTAFECILTDVRGAGARRVGVITLNRPKQLNALNDTLMDELGVALLAFDSDQAIGCIVLTGGEKAFAAGADIQAMAPYGFVDAYAIVKALKEGIEDVYPGDVAQEWVERWRENPKVLERELAAGG